MTDRRQAHSAEETAGSWELLTNGELSREEQALLRALAEGDDGDALRLEAHLPLDASFRERMTDQLEAGLAEAARRRRRRITRIAATTTIFAAAAGLLLILQPPAVQVPAYALAIEGQVATTRGADDPARPVHLDPDSVLDIRLTPASRVRTALTLSAFLERDGRAVPWAVPVQRASSGAFRIQGGVLELLQRKYGVWNAIFVIAPSTVTEPPADGAHSSDLTVLRTTLHYDAPAAP